MEAGPLVKVRLDALDTARFPRGRCGMMHHSHHASQHPPSKPAMVPRARVSRFNLTVGRFYLLEIIFPAKFWPTILPLLMTNLSDHHRGILDSPTSLRDPFGRFIQATHCDASSQGIAWQAVARCAPKVENAAFLIQRRRSLQRGCGSLQRC